MKKLLFLFIWCVQLCSSEASTNRKMETLLSLATKKVVDNLEKGMTDALVGAQELPEELLFMVLKEGFSRTNIRNAEVFARTKRLPTPIDRIALTRDILAILEHNKQKVSLWNIAPLDILPTGRINYDWPITGIVAASDGTLLAIESKEDSDDNTPCDLYSLESNGASAFTKLDDEFRSDSKYDEQKAAFSLSGNSMCLRSIYTGLYPCCKLIVYENTEFKWHCRRRSSVGAVALSPDGKHLAIDNEISDLTAARSSKFLNWDGRSTHACYSSNGQYLALSGYPDMIRVYDIAKDFPTNCYITATQYSTIGHCERKVEKYNHCIQGKKAIFINNDLLAIILPLLHLIKIVKIAPNGSMMLVHTLPTSHQILDIACNKNYLVAATVDKNIKIWPLNKEVLDYSRPT